MLARRQAQGGAEKSAYLCEDCSKWHLTSWEVDSPEDLVTEALAELPGGILVEAHRQPGGRLMDITLRRDRVFIRLSPEHLNVVRHIIDVVMPDEPSS